MAKGRYCPRDCGNRMIPMTPVGFNPNPKSKEDDLYICNDCYVGELYERFSRNSTK